MRSRILSSPLLWPYGGLAFLLIVLFWPAWIDGERLIIGSDTLLAHYPWFVLWRDLLAAGEPPFWNPYTFSGLPSLPTLQSGFGYPPHWLVTWLPPIRAINWMIGLHVLLAGLGTAWCAGRLGAPPSGQVISGASFALGSALTARLWAGHLSFVEANAWLPIATGLAVEIGRRRRVAWLALTVAMMTLAGQPEVLIFSLWWLPLWAGVGAWLGPGRRLLRAMVRVTLAVGLGGALAAFQLLPVLELLQVSNRLAGMGWDFRTGASLQPWHLLTAVAPHLYGDPRASYWPGPSHEWHERLFYIGLVPLLAAGLARGRWRWLCWGAAILAIVVSFGRYLPGYGLLLALPGYATFRIPSKHLVLTALALALAAGLGLEHLHGRRLARLASGGALALGVAAFGAASWLPPVAAALGDPARLSDVTVQHGFVAAAAVGLGWGAVTLAAVAGLALLPPVAARRGMLLLALVELSLVMRPHHLSPVDPAGLLAAAQPIAGHPRAVIIGPNSAPLANQGPVLKVVQPAGYMPLSSAGYMQLATGTISPSVIVAIAREDDPAIRLLGYDVILDQQRGRVIVVEPPSPVVWVARCAWPGGALEARQFGFPGSECVTRPMTTVAEEVTPPGPAAILNAGPGRLAVRAEGPGWLATRQPWYPGWAGDIDGVEAPVEILNGALVGIRLPDGIHTVTLRYRPAGLTGGLVVSGAAALLLLSTWWADRRLARRRSTSGSQTDPPPSTGSLTAPLSRSGRRASVDPTAIAEQPVPPAPREDDDCWDRLGTIAQRIAPASLERRLLYLLLLISVLLRMLWIGLPEGALIFDEKYYVNAARVLAGLEPQQGMYPDEPLGLDPNREHPPLAKVITAGSIRLLGDNAYGWRMPSVLFGVFAIFLVYRIGRRISGNPYLGLVAAMLLAFDNLAFVHGRIFTLDISMLALLLLGIDQYLRGRPVLAGVALALAALCKLPGAFGLLVLGAYELLRQLPSGGALHQPAPALRRLARLGCGFALAFVVLLGGLDRIFTEFPQPFAHLQHMALQAQLLRREAPSGVESLPWQWLWNDLEIPYLRVEQQVRVGDEVRESRPLVWFRGAMNPYVLMIWPLALSFAAYVWVRRRPGAETAALVLAWFSAMFLPFLAASLIWQRIAYIFYFLPVLPSITIAFSAYLLTSGVPRPLLWGYLLAVLLGFYGFFPYR